MQENVLIFLKLFTSIIWEAFPFIVLGALIAGILEEVVPQQAISRIVPKNRFLAVGLGGVLGLVFPMCECGIVPIMRRLLRKGLPLGTCVSYMMAGPIINVVVISTTIIAFEGFGLAEAMTTLRVGLGFLVAFVTGLIVEMQYRKYGNSLLTPLARPQKSLELNLLDIAATPDVHPAELRAGSKRPFSERIGNIAETALHDFKDIMVFLTIGAMIASLARFDDDQLRDVSTKMPAVTILIMMGLAIVMCLCSEADAFVAASFGQNLHVSAKLAFLVLGPMFDFKLLMMFTRVFRRRLILTIIFSAIIQVFVYTLIVHYTWEYVKKKREEKERQQSPTSAQIATPYSSLYG